MDKSIFDSEINNQARILGEVLNVEQCEKFYKYMKLLLEWNQKINLTAITDEKEIITKHFIDSITISKYINDKDSVVDIGTGAGFPGIPLKIVKEELKVTLVDSLNKRIKFLDDAIEKIELKNIETIHARAEEFGQSKKHREHYDLAISRAVARLNILIEYLLPTVKVGGKCICMKGPDAREEIEGAKKAIELLGGQICNIEEFNLPGTDIKRTIVAINKIKSTPNKYPRKPGTPAKEPIV